MEIYCTRPRCPRPQNYFTDLDDNTMLRTVQQKYCTSCGMPMILAGRYIATKLLGRGGFGAAFLARDRYTTRMRQCVVKQFLPAGTLTRVQLQIAQDLFEREAVVLEELGYQHDQIPDLFAYFPVIVDSFPPGSQEQFFYLAQEYIDGLNLEEELAQKGKLDESEAVEVLREILKVLKFVHYKNIIHRDIKPSNIMRDSKGKLYLLDFGAVKQVTNSPVGGAGASTGIYSMGFAPPEQMAGGQVFPSTDLYALAVTIITLLTGKETSELFDAYSNQWKWRMYVNVSPQLADVLDKMLVAAANQRFQSAQAVLDALEPQRVEQAQQAPTQITQPPSTQPPPTQPQPIQRRQTQSIQPFSTIELLAGAGFSGIEGGLIAIALSRLVSSPLILLVASGVILSILIYVQSRRWIEKFDLLIILGISFAIMYFIPALHGMDIEYVIFFSVAAGLVAIALTSLFRLIYRLLSLIL